MKTSIAINIKRVVAKIAKKSASMEANTACSIWHYHYCFLLYALI